MTAQEHEKGQMQAQGPGARVGVELTVEAARTLAATILAVLDEAEAGGYLA